jgi:hypothetical protein
LPVCAKALREFLARADDPSIGTLAGAVDPGHSRRVSLARRFIADHARLEQATSGLGDEPRAPS